MKGWKMKKIVAILVTAGLLFAMGFEKHIKYRGFHIDMMSQKPLTTGQNSFTLHINKPVKELKIKFFMPAMPGMPYMESWGKVTKGGDKYLVKAKLPTSGTWQVHIFITTDSGKKYRIKTSINL